MGQLVNSPHVVEDIWERGHPDKIVMYLRERYFWPLDLLKQRPTEGVYLFDPSKMPPSEHNHNILHYGQYRDWYGYRATPEMIRRGISLLNKYCYDSMQNGLSLQTPITDRELELFIEIIDCFSGILGFRQTMEAEIPQHMREQFIRRMTAKQDHEILEIKRKRDSGLYTKPVLGIGQRADDEAKMIELRWLIKQENPDLLKTWDIVEVPKYYILKIDTLCQQLL
jgi:hypothetical protein